MGRPRVRSAARPALSLGPFAALTPSRAPDRAPRQPWSAEEHSRFLDALDRTENGDSAGIWQSIARSVGARPVHEVKLHAHKYLLHLHAAGAGQGAAARDPALQRPWAREEDEAFENALAEVGEDVPDRWEQVAARVPGRSAHEARARYEELLVDVARIEAGEIPMAAQAAARNVGVRGSGASLLATASPPPPGASPPASARNGSMVLQSGAATAAMAASSVLGGASTPVDATHGVSRLSLGPDDDRLRLTLARDASVDGLFSPSRLFQGAGAWHSDAGSLLSPQRPLGSAAGFSFPPTPLGPNASGIGASSSSGGGGGGLVGVTGLSDGLPGLDDLCVTGSAITLRKWPADAEAAARAGVGGDDGAAASEDEGPPALKRQRLPAAARIGAIKAEQ